MIEHGKMGQFENLFVFRITEHGAHEGEGFFCGGCVLKNRNGVAHYANKGRGFYFSFNRVIMSMYQNRGRQQDKLIENFEIKISFAGHTAPEKREKL